MALAAKHQLSLVVESYFNQCEITSSGDHTRDIAAIKMALDDDVAIEWAIHNSQMLCKSVDNPGQIEDNVPPRGNLKRPRTCISTAKDAGGMLTGASESANEDGSKELGATDGVP